MGTVRTLVVLIAMEAEAAPLLEDLKLAQGQGTPWPAELPFKHYAGEVKGADVHVVVFGKDPTYGVDCVGTQVAAMATMAAITAFKPDLILNAGTAGGFAKEGCAVGEVYVGSSTCFHDRRIAIPGFDLYGQCMLKCQSSDKLAEHLELKRGIISTGNSLDCPKGDLVTILEKNKACIKEMEAASIAWTCSLFSVPFIAIKSVTDIVDGDQPTHEEFLANLTSAAKAIQLATAKAIKFVVNRSISEL